MHFEGVRPRRLFAILLSLPVCSSADRGSVWRLINVPLCKTHRMIHHINSKSYIGTSKLQLVESTAIWLVDPTRRELIKHTFSSQTLNTPGLFALTLQPFNPPTSNLSTLTSQTPSLSNSGLKKCGCGYVTYNHIPSFFRTLATSSI